jgi:hypothetical protein
MGVMAVGVVRDQVEQSRQVQHLAIRPAGKVGRGPQAGVLELANQFDASGELRWRALDPFDAG